MKLIQWQVIGDEIMKDELKPTPLQEKIMDAMIEANIDSEMASWVMTLLPLPRQQTIFMAWMEWYLAEFKAYPERDELPDVVREIMEQIPTPGFRKTKPTSKN